MAHIPVELSVVVPVYNGAATIERVVSEIHGCLAAISFELILVNDGSDDRSEMVCRSLVEQHPETVVFVHLARNFGEHNAVMAGLSQSRGRCVAVLDDDGQNPPSEILPLWSTLKTRSLDVVYGRYVRKQHSLFRNFGSWLNGRIATFLLTKPRGVYLSSFKVMNRFIVDELLKYRGPYPYLDGLIFRATRNVGQLDVRHASRAAGKSGYTLRKLLRLWLNMSLGFSIAPLRVAVYGGLTASAASVLLMLGILIDKLWINPEVPRGIPTVLAFITFFGGIQLTVMGMVGEYVGRIFLTQSGTPQFVIRDVMAGHVGSLEAAIHRGNAPGVPING